MSKPKKEKKAKPVETPLQKAEGQIKLAVILAFISAGLTLALTALSMAGTDLIGEFSLFNLLDVAIIGGLGFGVLRKNRVCAIALLAYFALDKVLVIMSDPSGASSSVASIVIWGSAYFNGIIGTFNWHKLMKEPQAQEVQEQPAQDIN